MSETSNTQEPTRFHEGKENSHKALDSSEFGLKKNDCVN